MPRILGIETSCDETAAAVVRDRNQVLSSVVASQIDLHSRFGGVVPEIAARKHIEVIGGVIERALSEAESSLEDMDAIAVTRGPGLIGSLLVGVSAAKAIAWQCDLPLLGVNHLEGHIRSTFIDHPQIEFPALALVVSGGHTQLYLCPVEGVYRTLARTRDDAAGEAFDKVAKLLGLGYPGGPLIERLAQEGDEKAFELPRARMKDGSLDFSFSGLKSAVRRLVQNDIEAFRPDDEGTLPQRTKDLAASFQKTVVRVLVSRAVRFARRESIPTILVSGGVACNGRLAREFERAAADENLQVRFPSRQYTTDNAAMIAAAGFLHLERGERAGMDLNADPNLKL